MWPVKITLSCIDIHETEVDTFRYSSCLCTRRFIAVNSSNNSEYFYPEAVKTGKDHFSRMGVAVIDLCLVYYNDVLPWN